MNAPAEAARRGTVLVVDDAPEMLRWLTDMLEAAAYSVLVACSGEEALDRLEYVVPDAVLLDAMMPGMSGFETCSRIKSNPGWSHIPVIFMTGLSETRDIVRGFDSGGVDYVVKPVRAEEVLARLATHLRNARVVRLAREAVDIGGQGVLLLDAQGRISWRSPRAEDWLAACFNESGGQPSRAWLQQVLGLAAGEVWVNGANGATQLTACSLGRAGLDETLLLLQYRKPVPSSTRIDSAALTPRETEVLSWLAKGKTNRDIAEILGVSPRTVNKHLEHIFEKLGVETRAAAAALASRSVGS